MTEPIVLICGGETGTGAQREEECASPLHDWPMPSGYIDAFEEAGWRLNHHWKNVRCDNCGLYGWIAGQITEKHVRKEARTDDRTEAGK